MERAPLDVIGVGNAIVDVIARVDEKAVADLGVPKGAMTLIDQETAEKVYAGMGPGIETSGGSVANTVAGIASLGGRSAFVGRVRDDQLGDIFRHDIRAVGVDYRTPSATTGMSTARCFVFVTPDAQRTMMTFLGASTEIEPTDVESGTFGDAEITYLEGYLWDGDKAKAALLKSIEAARKAGRRTALSLSDPFCVERHRDSFMELIRNDIDILFANEAEITALFQTSDFDDATRRVREIAPLAALTRGPAGAVVVAPDARVEVPADPQGDVIDTTGAGDLFAAGFLYGLTSDRGLEACARIGCLAAGSVIAQIGPRPQRPLSELVASRGL